MNNKTKSIVVILLIPLVVISFIYKNKTNFLNENKTQNQKQEANIIEKQVKLLNNGTIEILNLEEYIIGVVSCEMPASFEEEALKAQAVASRTYALKRIGTNNTYDLENSTNNQCFINEEQRKQKWNDGFSKYNTKVTNAVLETKNQYITYNDQIIDAFYFAKSNGYTENVINVFSESEIPYLVSVESSWDKETNNFIEEKSFSKQEFLKKLNLEDTQEINIKILERSSTNRVNKILINNLEIKGTDFRKKLGIKSTDFEIEIEENIKITTKGYGHGVGMSQYGANGFAKENKSYKEILEYFYKGTEIKNV